MKLKQIKVQRIYDAGQDAPGRQCYWWSVYFVINGFRAQLLRKFDTEVEANVAATKLKATASE